MSPKAATAVVEAPPVNLPATGQEEHGSVALMRMIEKAISNPEFDVAKMDHLLKVKERWEANEARKAFVRAFVAFKADAPKIFKNKHVSFPTSKGVTEYDHATLDQVCDIVGEALAEHKIAHDWDIEQSSDNAEITVTCILTHVLGHEKRVSMKAMPDDSGGKNLIQQKSSTNTYLQRLTLLAAAGLAPTDHDTDGNGPVEFISAEQKKTLIGLEKEVNADVPKFLKYLGIETIDQLPATRFNEAKTALEAKRKAKE